MGRAEESAMSGKGAGHAHQKRKYYNEPQARPVLAKRETVWLAIEATRRRLANTVGMTGAERRREKERLRELESLYRALR